MIKIPYGRQHINEEDIESVVEVLKSDWLTQGPVIEEFERSVANYCGVSYSIAVQNATAALHIACLSIGLGPGDLLWTSPNTFVASANCGIYCGAKVDFVDIDPKTYNMSVTALEEKLQEAERLGRLPNVVVPVHFSGQSCEMVRIAELAREYGFKVIEDASHAIGGRYCDTRIGSCMFSDIAIFSFHPVKIVTTGEGGMVLTNRKDLYDKLIRLRTHGITRDTSRMQQESHGPWYYEQIELGLNYRMTELQAALGLSQMKRLDEFVARRHDIANRYYEGLKDLEMITLPWQHPDHYSAFHLYVIRVKQDKTSKTRREIFENLRQVGILVNVHYIPVHTQPYYKAMGFKWGDFPEAEKYYWEAISLPMFFSIKEEEQEYVISAIRKEFI